MKTRITRDELRRRLDDSTPTVLLEALPEKYYLEGHIPGAVQLNYENVRSEAPRLVPNKNATIVIYCASATCRNSHIAANQFDALGYSDVRVYAEGKKDWLEAGLPLGRNGHTA
jgi:rhodanese-related sulfurtransferase